MRLISTTKVVQKSAVGEVDGQPVTAYHVDSRVGESPAWQPAEAVLYWIDVRRQHLRRLSTDTDTVTTWLLPDVVGASALCQSGKIWLALRHELVVLDIQTGQLERITSIEQDRPHNRLNDGKVSPTGRWFLFGSMDDRADKQPTGQLHRIAPGGHTRPLWDGLFVCNGIAFSRDGRQILFSDSWAGKVFIAPWNEDTGEMGQPTLFCELNESAGRPDGAVVDNDGLYWSAGVSAGRLNAVSPSGELARSLPLPCRAPTMPAFGGLDARTMFVTSLVRGDFDLEGRCDGALLAFPSPTIGHHGPLFAN